MGHPGAVEFWNAEASLDEEKMGAPPEKMIPLVSEGELHPKASVPLSQPLGLGPAVERAQQTASPLLSPELLECKRNWVRRSVQARQLAARWHSIAANTDESL